MDTGVDSERWLDRRVEEMTEDGAFGPDVRFVSFKLDNRHTGKDQFASTVLYGSVTVRGDDDDDQAVRRLVIKLKHRVPELRDMMSSDLQFQNEILFYERILPFLRALLPPGRESCAPSTCRYRYGRNDGGQHVLQDMIVLDNDTARGYEPARSAHRLFMDFDHLVVALRTLAKFHGLSYRAKKEDPKKFEELVQKIEVTHWNSDGEWIVPSDIIRELSSGVMDRLTGRQGGEDDERTSKFREECLGNIYELLRRVEEPDEPMAVLCHGDFNRNNVLFRYDDATGRPADALPFDMATVRYGSPALDLSFFLYMNADRHVRERHWDELLDEYCVALEASVSDVSPAIWVPNRETLRTEMRDRAFYGLQHVTFFMRLMMEEKNPPDLMQFVDTDLSEMPTFVMSLGGDEATDVIADAYRHYIDLRYTDG